VTITDAHLVQLLAGFRLLVAGPHSLPHCYLCCLWLLLLWSWIIIIAIKNIVKLESITLPFCDWFVFFFQSLLSILTPSCRCRKVINSIRPLQTPSDFLRHGLELSQFLISVLLQDWHMFNCILCGQLDLPHLLYTCIVSSLSTQASTNLPILHWHGSHLHLFLGSLCFCFLLHGL
jgi:hypothetical protein